MLKLHWWAVGFAAILVVGLVDYWTGNRLLFSPFYLIPVSLMAWRTGWAGGISAALLSTAVWLAAEVGYQEPRLSTGVYAWNTVMRLINLLVVTVLVVRLRTEVHKQTSLARRDALTGACNRRVFIELVQAEIARAARFHHPFSIAYFDLDNFKPVNDQFGHRIGDEVLRVVVNRVGDALRQTDSLARLGGDEFGILFPETESASAQAVMEKMLKLLNQDMAKRGWPVTVSAGILTIDVAREIDVDQAMHLADQLMYRAKEAGKDQVCAARYPLAAVVEHDSTTAA